MISFNFYTNWTSLQGALFINLLILASSQFSGLVIILEIINCPNSMKLLFVIKGLIDIQGFLAQNDFWDFEKIVLCKIRTIQWLLHSQFPLVRILLHSNSSSTNFIPMALKFVLVEIVLVETVLVGDPLYLDPSRNMNILLM